jgi:transposase-like protein
MEPKKSSGLLKQLRDGGVSDTQILEHLLEFFMGEAHACGALESCLNEYGLLGEEPCPTCGSEDITINDFDYSTAKPVYICRDCEDQWY